MSRKLYLAHTGTPQMYDFDPHGSGRYRQGSGEEPYQHKFNWLYEFDKAKKDHPNMSEAEVCDKIFNMSTTEARARKQWMEEDLKSYLSHRVYSMRYDSEGNKKMSTTAIAEKLTVMGYDMSEANVRKYLKAHEDAKYGQIKDTAESLKETLKVYRENANGDRQYLDIGEGIANRLRISQTAFDAAVQRLKDEGYIINNIQVNQINSQIKGQKTTMRLLGEPGITDHELALDAYSDLGKIHYINEVYNVDAQTMGALATKPVPVSLDRIKINYADNNADVPQPKDGVIELRPGVADLDLGNGKKYAQVRINVDDKYYLKGMAIYNYDMPEGVDIIFNTNKSEGAPPSKVFKPLKRTRTLEDGSPDPNSPIDWNNPFGATIKPFDKGGQHQYTDENGKLKWSAINIVNEEGSWNEWKKGLPSQLLTKQPDNLARTQLDIAYHKKLEEYEKIQNIGIPAIKEKFLKDFADSCEQDAVDLKGWAMIGQSTKVLLPGTTLAPNECYCPDYPEVIEEGPNKGQRFKVVCIRYPHNGPEEIVELYVNNHNKECKKIYGPTPKDLIAIPPSQLPKLGGADCDGDNVTVIPNNNNAIVVKDLLKGMEGYDAKIEYATDGSKETMSKRSMGIEMGKSTNLIMDMRSLYNPTTDELVRAFKYNQVVVDAHKHKLDWKQAAKDLKIAELRKKYQGNSQGGAYSLMSRASGPEYVDERKLGYTINKETGDKEYIPTNKTKLKKITNPDGTNTWVQTDEKVKTKTDRMYTVDNAYDLIKDRDLPPTTIERIYADYANNMKDLARKCRLESLEVKKQEEKPTARAKQIYAEERTSIDEKLFKRDEYAPQDRAALRAATIYMKQVKEENPYMDTDEYKRKSAQAMTSARARCFKGGKKEKITITDKEWEAIENNAIDKSKLNKILLYADDDSIKGRVMNSNKSDSRTKLSPAEIATLKAYVRGGNVTWATIAKEFGISVATAKRYYDM